MKRPEENPDWNFKPLTEEEAERMHEDSERLTDRIMARLSREGEGADYERILEEEIARRRAERGEPPLTPEQEAERASWIAEINRAAEEALANPNPELEEELRIEHPLATEARELGLRLRRDARR